MDFLEVHPAAASKSAAADFDHFKNEVAAFDGLLLEIHPAANRSRLLPTSITLRSMWRLSMDFF